MSNEAEHSESEFYCPGELQFQDNSDLTETNNERVGERENQGKNQEEAVNIFLYVLTLTFDSQTCWRNVSCCNVTIKFYMTFSQL